MIEAVFLLQALALAFTPLLVPLLVLRAVAMARRAPRSIAFFHPYADSGGGGERVLWKAVEATLERDPGADVRIYTGDSHASPDEILGRARTRFNLALKAKPAFVYVRSRVLLEARLYPAFTLLGQSLGAVVVALECLLRFTPAAFVDTTGFAFSYPLARHAFGCRVVSYTHYPTISSDMLQRVRERRTAHNNRSTTAASSTLKLAYYHAFAAVYGVVGRAAHAVMVNSTWTRAHIDSLWRVPGRTTVVFPPCDTATLRRMPLEGREPLVLSLGQFRPEKDHALQLEAFARFARGVPGGSAQDMPALAHDRARLVMIGGCRGAGDEARVAELRAMAERLGVADRVDFLVNAPFSELKDHLRRAAVGLHTMWNEHFGIGVVEFMAAGVVTVAHNSGGPRSDIVVEHGGGPTGFLAATADEYAAAMQRVFDRRSDGDDMLDLRRRARDRVEEFSDERFADAWCRVLQGASLLSPSKKSA